MDQAKLNQVLARALQTAGAQYLEYAKHCRGLVDADGSLPTDNRQVAEAFDRQAADCESVLGLIIGGQRLQWQEPKKPPRR